MGNAKKLDARILSGKKHGGSKEIKKMKNRSWFKQNKISGRR